MADTVTGAVAEALAELRTDLPSPSRSVIVADAMVADTMRRLDASGVIDKVEQWAAKDAKAPGGAPEHFSKRALLVTMFVCARMGWPMLAKTWCDTMFYGFTDEMRVELGIPDTTPERWDADYRNVRTRFHAIEALIDFSVFPKNRRFSPDRFAELMVERMIYMTPERIAEHRDRQLWFINQIVRISHHALPKVIWDRWGGALAVDATPIATYARWPETTNETRKEDRTVLVFSCDEDGGWYVKEGDHGDHGDGSTLTKLLYGYEHTLTFLCSPTDDERGMVPKLLMAMALPHIPGESPGNNGRTAVKVAVEAALLHGVKVTLVAGDNAYVNALAEQFAIPLRAMGIDLVLDYNKDQTGLQGSHHGLKIVDGAWYCPAMPEPLVTAKTDHRAGLINDATYDRRIKDRRPFAARRKALPDPDGTIRMLCPAVGPSGTLRCPHKPRSMLGPKRAPAHSTKRPRKPKRRVDLNDLLVDKPPRICRQESVTIPPEARGRFEQGPIYGTEDWRSIYQTMRSTNEGGNGTSKNPAGQNLEEAGSRRIRGQAANALITCFMYSANNLTLIESFAKNAKPDENGEPRLKYHPRKNYNTSRAKRPKDKRSSPAAAPGDPPPADVLP